MVFADGSMFEPWNEHDLPARPPRSWLGLIGVVLVVAAVLTGLLVFAVSAFSSVLSLTRFDGPWSSK